MFCFLSSFKENDSFYSTHRKSPPAIHRLTGMIDFHRRLLYLSMNRQSFNSNQLSISTIPYIKDRSVVIRLRKKNHNYNCW